MSTRRRDSTIKESNKLQDQYPIGGPKMMHRAELKVHSITSRVVREQPTSNNLVQGASDTLRIICQEASEYELTTADVVKAILHPVSEMKRGCDCSTCKVHRNELNEETLRGLATQMTNGSPSHDAPTRRQ